MMSPSAKKKKRGNEKFKLIHHVDIRLDNRLYIHVRQVAWDFFKGGKMETRGAFYRRPPKLKPTLFYRPLSWVFRSYSLQLILIIYDVG